MKFFFALAHLTRGKVLHFKFEAALKHWDRPQKYATGEVTINGDRFCPENRQKLDRAQQSQTYQFC